MLPRDLQACVPGLAALVRDTMWLLIGALLFSSIVRAEPSDAEIDQGRELYGDFCASCHGRDMVNPGGVTADLRKFPKDDFERFKNAVLNGKPPAMPPWRDKIGDDDLKVLWAYVRSGG
jgi:mono/diheme cytochrome c family protein